MLRTYSTVNVQLVIAIYGNIFLTLFYYLRLKLRQTILRNLNIHAAKAGMNLLGLIAIPVVSYLVQ